MSMKKRTLVREDLMLKECAKAADDPWWDHGFARLSLIWAQRKLDWNLLDQEARAAGLDCSAWEHAALNCRNKAGAALASNSGHVRWASTRAHGVALAMIEKLCEREGDPLGALDLPPVGKVAFAVARAVGTTRESLTLGSTGRALIFGMAKTLAFHLSSGGLAEMDREAAVRGGELALRWCALCAEGGEDFADANADLGREALRFIADEPAWTLSARVARAEIKRKGDALEQEGPWFDTLCRAIEIDAVSPMMALIEAAQKEGIDALSARSATTVPVSRDGKVGGSRRSYPILWAAAVSSPLCLAKLCEIGAVTGIRTSRGSLGSAWNLFAVMSPAVLGSEAAELVGLVAAREMAEAGMSKTEAADAVMRALVAGLSEANTLAAEVKALHEKNYLGLAVRLARWTAGSDPAPLVKTSRL